MADLMPQMAEPAWPPATISPPPPGEGPRWARVLPKWQRQDFVPEMELIEWPLLAQHRAAHTAALAALENASGHDPATADQDAIREALRSLRDASKAAVAELQATDAARPALESYAAARERLTPPAAGLGGGMTPVPVSAENASATAHNARVDAFNREHREEREALRRDHDRLIDVLGPAFQVVDDDETVRLLGIGGPEAAAGSRGPGEPAPPLEEQRA